MNALVQYIIELLSHAVQRKHVMCYLCCSICRYYVECLPYVCTTFSSPTFHGWWTRHSTCTSSSRTHHTHTTVI